MKEYKYIKETKGNKKTNKQTNKQTNRTLKYGRKIPHYIGRSMGALKVLGFFRTFGKTINVRDPPPR